MQGSFNRCKSVNVIHHTNDINYKNQLIISIDIQNVLDKNHDSFKLKTVERLRIEEIYINVTKAADDKTEANIIINGENSKHSQQNQKTR